MSRVRDKSNLIYETVIAYHSPPRVTPLHPMLRPPTLSLEDHHHRRPSRWHDCCWPAPPPSTHLGLPSFFSSSLPLFKATLLCFVECRWPYHTQSLLAAAASSSLHFRRCRILSDLRHHSKTRKPPPCLVEPRGSALLIARLPPPPPKTAIVTSQASPRLGCLLPHLFFPFVSPAKLLSVSFSSS